MADNGKYLRLPWIKVDIGIDEDKKTFRLLRRKGVEGFGHHVLLLQTVGWHGRVEDAALTSNGEPTDLEWLADQVHWNGCDEGFTTFLDLEAELELIDRDLWRDKRIVAIPKLLEYAAKILSDRESARQRRQQGAENGGNRRATVARRSTDGRRPSSSVGGSIVEDREGKGSVGKEREGEGRNAAPEAPPDSGPLTLSLARDVFNGECEQLLGCSQYAFRQSLNSLKPKSRTELERCIEGFTVGDLRSATRRASSSEWCMGATDRTEGVVFSFVWVLRNLGDLLAGRYGSGPSPPPPEDPFRNVQHPRGPIDEAVIEKLKQIDSEETAEDDDKDRTEEPVH